jgi:hypothetical protein
MNFQEKINAPFCSITTRIFTESIFHLSIIIELTLKREDTTECPLPINPFMNM